MSTQSNFPDWGSVQPAGGERHLPVYLLLDTSQSMEKTGIPSLQQGLEMFKREVSDDSFARDVARIGVITFANDAELVTGGLLPISDFQPPELVAGGVTRLDLAFEKLLESMDRDVARPIKGEAGQKGDWKPMVFVLTDGWPTNEEGEVTDELWQPAWDKVTNRPEGDLKPSAIVAVGCSDNVGDTILKTIAYTKPTDDNSDPPAYAFRISSNEAAFVSLFQWFSQSIIGSVQEEGEFVAPDADSQLSSDVMRIP